MARTVSFLVQTNPSNRLEIRDYDTTISDQSSAYHVSGFGEWTVNNVTGAEYIGNSNARIHFEHKETGREIGGFTVDEIATFTIDGVEQVGNFSALDGFLDAIAQYLLQSVIIPLPAGASTAAKQDALAALIGLGNGSVASSTNGWLKSIDTNTGAINTTVGLGNIDLGLIKGQAEITNNKLTDANASLSGIASNISDLLGASAPKEPVVPQLDTAGETTGYLSVSGSKAGSFNYLFTKNAGTSGILTLYGSNNSSNAAYDVMIGATASLVANGAGVITWSTPYKYIKAIFTTQVGAGSTFDGTVYAI